MPPRGRAGGGGGGGGASSSTASAVVSRPRRGGVSSLWPLLPFEGPRPYVATLPADIAERFVDLMDNETLRTLRLVSRATRDAVDARWRSVRMTKEVETDAFKSLPRFSGLEVLDATLHQQRLDGKLPLLTRGLQRLPHLKELRLLLCAGSANPARLGKLAALAQALPRGLEALRCGWDRTPESAAAFLDATAAMPQLRALRLEPARPSGSLARLSLSVVVRHFLQQRGDAWSRLEDLGLSRLGLGAYEALAAATRFTALRTLGLSNCSKDGDGHNMIPPHLAADGGLRLLAKAPWIQQLTELRLSSLDFFANAPTDALFTGLDLPRLERLELCGFKVGPPFTGLASASLPALTSLVWRPWERYVFAEDVAPFASAPWYAGLSELKVIWSDLPIAVQVAMVSAPFSRGPCLAADGISSPRLAAAIARVPGLRSLRVGLSNSPLEVWQRLAGAPMDSLRELELTRPVPDDIKEAIRGAAWAGQLTRLQFAADA